MSEPLRIRVLIADSHRATRDGLAALLRHQPDIQIVGLATNAADTIHLFRFLIPDVLLLDIGMPAIEGITTLKAIRADYPGARIIAMTIMDGGYEFQALEAGATACILKDAPRQRWFSTIRSLAGRQDAT